MLVGREREQERIDSLLDAARTGRSGVLVVVGEAGIGKTALLDYVAERAAGYRVLRASGIESEANIPFATLLELLRPALPLLDRIPPPQAIALESALALRPARAEERFAVGAATLSLLAACAEDGPVAVLVDDAHWVDASSGEALVFAARRLVADRVAVLFSARENEPSPLAAAGLPTVRLDGLGREPAAKLLGPFGSDLTEVLYEATGGNPLAIVELSSATDLLALAAVEGAVPVPATISRAYLRRADSLSDSARAVLVVAAASGTGDSSAIERAAASLGLAPAKLAEAEAVGLVNLAPGRVEFRHPLARSAVYGAAPVGERRAAHRAIAAVLSDRDIDRRAWHLAAAAVGVDDSVSAALEEAGYRAKERSAYAVAAAAFERAARFAADEERRSEMLWAAAQSCWLAGLADRAEELLGEARALATDPTELVAIDHLDGQIAVRRGPVREAHGILTAAAGRADPEQAVVLLAEAAIACFYAGDARLMLRTAEEVESLVTEHSPPASRFYAGMTKGMALILGGDGGRGADAVRDAMSVIRGSEELDNDPARTPWLLMGRLWLRDTLAGRVLVARVLEEARSRSALGALPSLLNHLARDHAGGSEWQAAHAWYEEAIHLSRELGQRTELAGGLSGQPWLEARLGRAESCRAHADEALGICREFEIGLFEVWSVAALGDLELGLGRPEAAVEYFEQRARTLERLGITDPDLSSAPELVEACLRLGRSDGISKMVESLSESAVAKGQPWSLARALRCRGLAAAEGDFEPLFEESLELHDDTPDVFEAARTHLAYGGRLRRNRQRVRAREHLRAALDRFELLDAAPWANLARSELAATGEHVRSRGAGALEQLTAQEMQIAMLLSEGQTTREAAAALFLSPKTIEYHLRHVYQKLGVNSRSDLAEAVRSTAAQAAH